MKGNKTKCLQLRRSTRIKTYPLTVDNLLSHIVRTKRLKLPNVSCLWLTYAKEATITKIKKAEREFSKLSSIHFLHEEKKNFKFPYKDHIHFRMIFFASSECTLDL